MTIITPTTPSNDEIRSQTRHILKGKWNRTAGVSLFFLLPLYSNQFIPTQWLTSLGMMGNLIIFGLFVVTFIIIGPINVGIAKYYLNLVHDKNPSFGDLWTGLHPFWRNVRATYRVGIICMLWSLLLIVPGIIAYIKYQFVYIIIAKDPTISPKNAMRRSAELINGHKWQAFRLQLRLFIYTTGGFLALGVGFLWAFAYYQTALTTFYKTRLEAVDNGSGVNIDSAQIM